MAFWITQNANPADSDGNTQFLRVCLTPLTADPTDLYEGDLWYRSDLQQLRQYRGGVAPVGVSAPTNQTSRTGAHSFGTTYPNPGLTPMMVTVVVGLHAGDSVIAYSDLSSPPTSRVQSAALMASAGTGLLYIPLSFWVMHGAYYRLVAFGGTPTTNEWMEWN